MDNRLQEHLKKYGMTEEEHNKIVDEMHDLLLGSTLTVPELVDKVFPDIDNKMKVRIMMFSYAMSAAEMLSKFSEEICVTCKHSETCKVKGKCLNSEPTPMQEQSLPSYIQ